VSNVSADNTKLFPELLVGRPCIPKSSWAVKNSRELKLQTSGRAVTLICIRNVEGTNLEYVTKYWCLFIMTSWFWSTTHGPSAFIKWPAAIYTYICIYIYTRIYSFSSLSYDRSKASPKASSPHSVI
jgi:hypothetical protein